MSYDSLFLQDYTIPVCAQLLVMIIVIAGRLSFFSFVFKPVSLLVGHSRLRQTRTFSLRIHLVEQRSPCPYLFFNYYLFNYWSLEAALGTSASRSITGPTVFSLDRNKPVTI